MLILLIIMVWQETNESCMIEKNGCEQIHGVQKEFCRKAAFMAETLLTLIIQMSLEDVSKNKQRCETEINNTRKSYHATSECSTFKRKII